MSVTLVRYVLLIGFVYCVKSRTRREIDSLLKVGLVIALFPIVMSIPEAVIAKVLGGVGESYMLSSAIYAMEDLLRSALTVLVYFLLYIYTAGKMIDLGYLLKCQTKKLWMILGILAVAGAVLCYVQNVNQAMEIQKVLQEISEQADLASAVGLLQSMSPKKSFVYGRYLIYAAIMLVTAFGYKEPGAEEL